jgi:hypothetical protein
MIFLCAVTVAQYPQTIVLKRLCLQTEALFYAQHLTFDVYLYIFAI